MVRGGHVQHGGVGGPEHIGVDVLDGGPDAESPGHVDSPLGAHLDAQLGEDGVQRTSGGSDEGHLLGVDWWDEGLPVGRFPCPGRDRLQHLDPVGEQALPVEVPSSVGHPLCEVHGFVGHLGLAVTLLLDADRLDMLGRYVGVVLAHPELEEGLEAVFETGLGCVMAAHASRHPPDLVVLVGPGDLELQNIGRRVGGRGLPSGFQGGGQGDRLHR